MSLESPHAASLSMNLAADFHASMPTEFLIIPSILGPDCNSANSVNSVATEVSLSLLSIKTNLFIEFGMKDGNAFAKVWKLDASI